MQLSHAWRNLFVYLSKGEYETFELSISVAQRRILFSLFPPLGRAILRISDTVVSNDSRCPCKNLMDPRVVIVCLSLQGGAKGPCIASKRPALASHPIGQAKGPRIQWSEAARPLAGFKRTIVTRDSVQL